MADRFRLPAGLEWSAPCIPRFPLSDDRSCRCRNPALLAVQALEETYPSPPPPLATSDARLAGYARAARRPCASAPPTPSRLCHRERVQWMEDLYLHGRVAAYAFGDTACFAAPCFRGAERPAGRRINGFMPSSGRIAPSRRPADVAARLADYRRFAGMSRVRTTEADCRKAPGTDPNPDRRRGSSPPGRRDSSGTGRRSRITAASC